MIQVYVITRPTRIPAIAASARSSASARIVRPSVERARKTPSAHDRGSRADDRDELRLGEADAADHVDLELVDLVRLRLRAVRKQQHLPQHEREPDRREEEAHEAGAARAQADARAPRRAEREHGGGEHAEQRRRDHPESKRSVERVGGERSERHEVAVREVDEPQDPVDERDAGRSDRDHRSGDEAVCDQLPEHEGTRPVAAPARAGSPRSVRGRGCRASRPPRPRSRRPPQSVRPRARS